MQCQAKFLSTLSLRRATESQLHRQHPFSYFYPRSPCGERHVDGVISYRKINFYPRSPCGERRAKFVVHCQSNAISIHALLAESDPLSLNVAVYSLPYFYPRSPCGERLHALLQGHFIVTISIHALLAESDETTTGILILNPLFLSTLSLRRATRLPTALRTPHQRFLSTLSLRRATHQE